MDKYKAVELLNIIMTIIVVGVGAFVLAVLLSGCGGSDEEVAADDGMAHIPTKPDCTASGACT